MKIKVTYVKKSYINLMQEQNTGIM